MKSKKYELDETNRRRMNMILGNALTIGTIMYTEDEKKCIDRETLQRIVSRANQIKGLAKEIASQIGVELCEEENPKISWNELINQKLLAGYDSLVDKTNELKDKVDNLRDRVTTLENERYANKEE